MISIKKFIKDPRIFIFLAPLILLSPIFLTGKAFYWGTPSTQFVPWWDFAWRSVLSGQLPLWNPLLGMGAPLAANYQSALFYPLTWIYFLAYIIGGVKFMSWAISLVVCGHLIWSGLGTAFILRELKVDKFGQALGGLAFSLSGYLVARAGFLSINATAAWIPWLLLFLYRIKEGKAGNWFKLTAVMSMLLLAGHAQTAWHAILLGGFWVIYWAVNNSERGRRIKSLTKALAGYLGAGLLGMGISAVQLFPTAEYLFLSQRAGEYGLEGAMTYSFWPWRFLTLLLPDLFGNPAKGLYWGYGNFWEDAVYIGLFPILLAVGFLGRSLFINRRSGKSKKELQNLNPGLFLGVITLISFLLALGDNTGIFPFLYKNIPGVNLFQAPTRYTIMAEISLALLAGLGANTLTKPDGKRLYFTRLAVAGCVAVVIGAVLVGIFLQEIRFSFVYSAGRAGLIGLMTGVFVLTKPAKSEIKRIRTWSILVLCLVGFDLICAGWGLNPGIQREFYEIPYPRDLDGRVWMPSDIEYNLKFDKFFRFDTFVEDEKLEEMHQDLLPNLPTLHGIMLTNNFDPIVPGYYQEWMDRINSEYPAQNILNMMNISNIIDIDENENTKLVSLPNKIDPLRVVGCVAIVNPVDQDPDLILENESDLLEDIVIFSEEQIICEPGATGQIEIIKQKNGHLKLNVDLDNNGWIFWSQTWYPGWEYKVDGGKRVQTYRVNYLFQGIPVPQGAHHVEIIYRPASVIWGSVISGLSLVVLAAISMVRKMQL
jgi:hypothetical protein